MARARYGHRPDLPVSPVGEILVLDLDGDGGSRCPAIQHAAGDACPVALDAHPPTAAVAHLAAAQLGIDLPFIQGQTCRHPLEDSGERWTVGFARGQET